MRVSPRQQYDYRDQIPGSPDLVDIDMTRDERDSLPENVDHRYHGTRSVGTVIDSIEHAKRRKSDRKRGDYSPDMDWWH